MDEEQEEDRGSERVLELSEDRADEVVDTASERSVRALQECKLTQYHLYKLAPGPNDCEGLTQTRPALLPYAFFDSPLMAFLFNHSVSR